MCVIQSDLRAVILPKARSLSREMSLSPFVRFVLTDQGSYWLHAFEDLF